MAVKRSIDPSRTILLRRQFGADIQRRSHALQLALRDLLLKDGVLASEVPPLTQNSPADKVAFQFKTNPEKVREFDRWLQRQIDEKVLTMEGVLQPRPWTAKYIMAAYRKGVGRAYTDVNKPYVGGVGVAYAAAKEQFIRDAFAQPVPIAQLELLYTRAYEGLKGITASMSTQLSRILADGFVHGRSPVQIAREMTKAIDTLTATRAMGLARTEIIHAHAEAQLDGYELLKVEKVFAEVEVAISTAGDTVVCEHCKAVEGQVYTIKQARGLIPLHTNCRCCWSGVLGVEGKTKGRTGRQAKRLKQ